MIELPRKYQKPINLYQPIKVDGFTLYPITVEHYEEFLIASQSIGYMTQKLPLKYMSLPLLSAFFKMDFQRAIEGELPTGLLTSTLVALVLALRLANDGEDTLEACKGFEFVTSQNDPMMLKALVFTDKESGEQITITPVQFATMRPIIAAQNGIEIPNEDSTPELVQAEQDLAEKNAPKLDVKVINLIHSACALTGVEEEEIYSWAVLKLTNRLASFKRIIDYMICSISEGNGASWKGGNPAPHPWFDRLKTESDALMSLDRFASGQGIQAVNNALSQTK